MTTFSAGFNRFTLDLPIQLVLDCAHQGPCDEDVARWLGKFTFPEDATPEAIRDELRETGAYDHDELNDDAANRSRILWIAAGNAKDAFREFFPQSDWQYDVRNGDTQLGYDDWLAHQMESRTQDDITDLLGQRD